MNRGNTKSRIAPDTIFDYGALGSPQLASSSPAQCLMAPEVAGLPGM
jgi:hypothetical protein